ncbi:hypothetical protein [Dietzia sp. ANT_WB102]|uniref:hypothetical protein n=1 Tax=Dietzia sp. ANT_WB102 TaxID=2597345 RepID=UPI002104A3F0|nr:hypothetical protein [Dietzia sp. ANT_WB102]
MAATALRAWVAAAGWFYWDDLILHSRAAARPFPDLPFLFADHDGHLMPGGMALTWIAAHAAPLDFRMPLLQIAVLQLVAGAALARMLWVQLSGRTVMLVPLVAALAIPLGLPSATWWAAALNALPLTAAMAWTVASMVRLGRTGRRRHAVGAAVATVVGLLFVEKALLIPVVAAAVLAGSWWTAGGSRAELQLLWRRTRCAWSALAAIVTVWAAIFVVVVGRVGGASSGPLPVEREAGAGGAGPGVIELLDHAYRLAVVPTLGGGPWRWGRWHPGPPMADPPVVAVVVGFLAVATVLTWSLIARRRTGAIWAAAALYPLVSVVLVAVGRTGPDTAAEIVQTLRYHAELPVVLAAAAALAIAAPRSEHGEQRLSHARRWLPASGALGLAVLVASSVVSTVTYRHVWSEQPSRDYTEPLLATLRERTEPLLDTEVPLEVLLPVTTPANRLSALLTGVPDVPEVGAWTRDPVAIDAHGALHPADVVPGRSLPQGPEPGCGHRVGPDGARLALDGPLLGRDWVVRLNLFADADGHVAVRLDDGDEVTAPVESGLGTVFVRVEGGGTRVTVTPGGGASELCVGSGPVGVLVPR